MLLSLLLAFTAQSNDTITVDKAQIAGPYPIQQPYVTDSVNPKGKVFDCSELLSSNKQLIRQSETRTAPSSVIRKGDALNALPDSATALSVLRFHVQTSKYIKGKMETGKLRHYSLFVNGEERTDGTFNLTPGRAEFALLTYSTSTEKDSFDIKLIGEDWGTAVEVNPEGKRSYTMADMMLGEHYYNIALSPSGKYLVTTSYNMKADGSAPYTTLLQDLTTGEELLNHDGYLPLNWLQGKKDVLYFTRNGARGRELVTYTPADRKTKVLADNLPDGSFSISPNEDYLIISQAEEGDGFVKGLKRLQEPDDRMPGWRSRNTLWRHDLKTGVTSRLSFGSTSIYLSDISDDGRQLLLQYSRFNAARQPFDRTGYLRMDAYTGKVDTLISDTTFVSEAKFSPDARQLLIAASPDAFGGIGREVKPGQTPNAFDKRLYLYDINSRQVTPLLKGWHPSVDRFEWNRGDGKVYILATDRADRSLFRLDVRTKETVRYELPVTMVSRFSVAQTGKNPRAVFYGNTAERAREMFACTLNKARPETRRIGSIDFDKLYGDVSIGTCHDWQFKATRGDSIDGFYFLPPDFDAAKKYPLIVYYYGGCTPTTKSLEFQYPLQVLAGQGYVVYAVNPSGAIGYGQEFAARHVNTWGMESADDIIEGTKTFCSEHAFIDADRIGCMGASYGGFMTEYLQTRTDIFAAAVSHAGISNIASYWGGGYWGYSYGECAQYGSYPWNNPDLYVKQSPLFNADKIHTPLLMLHGTADTNVPTTESQQLFTALKILGREVSYIQIDGENHVITDYRKRLAWQDAIFAWFAKHLKGENTWWDSLGL